MGFHGGESLCSVAEMMAICSVGEQRRLHKNAATTEVTVRCIGF